MFLNSFLEGQRTGGGDNGQRPAHSAIVQLQSSPLLVAPSRCLEKRERHKQETGVGTRYRVEDELQGTFGEASSSIKSGFRNHRNYQN